MTERSHLRTWRSAEARARSLFAAAFLFVIGCGIGSRIGEDLTVDGLLALRCGMSEGEVLALIGAPLAVQPASATEPTGGIGGSAWAESRRWIYATPGPLGGGLEVTVGFDASGKVSGAGAEEYDLGLWLCRPERCPWVLNESRLRVLLK